MKGQLLDKQLTHTSVKVSQTQTILGAAYGTTYVLNTEKVFTCAMSSLWSLLHPYGGLALRLWNSGGFFLNLND